MAQDRRSTPPKADDTGSARRKAYRPLQRRLRHIASRVDWTDVAVAIVMQAALDALGGGAGVVPLLQLLASLLGLDN